jgi:hypothetical protein
MKVARINRFSVFKAMWVFISGKEKSMPRTKAQRPGWLSC